MTKFKQIISYTILVIASFLSAFPLYYMLCGATNQSIDVVRGRLIPGTYLIENFKTLVDMQNLPVQDVYLLEAGKYLDRTGTAIHLDSVYDHAFQTGGTFFPS